MNTIQRAKRFLKPILSKQSWRELGDYVGVGKHKKTEAIIDQDSLAHFIHSRASHVAQTTLYGYLRTRAGTRFPELFENPDILTSINMAKWQVWVACVSDLSAFLGLLMAESKVDSARISRLLDAAASQVFTETGSPEEAGKDFDASVEKACQRIRTFDWSKQYDDDSIFSQSPQALYYWSPIAEQLKERDENIVRNSVRFRWIDIRRSARKQMNIELLFGDNPADAVSTPST